MAQAQPIQVRVVIVAPANGLDQEWIQGLRADPAVELLACVGVLSRGVEAVAQFQPNVLIIDRSVEEIEETLYSVYAVAPQTLCFAVLPHQDMALVRRLVGAGARDILVKPLNVQELVESLRAGVQMEDARRQRAGMPSLIAPRQHMANGKVIVVMGPKGGVGTTTVATNVAVALKLVSGKEVALADFSLQFGDVAALMNLWSKHTIHDLAVHHQAIDDRLMELVTMPHTSGVKVIQAPAEPELAADMTSEHVVSIIDALRSRFAYVVVDCWSFLDEITETLMGLADQVLLVTTPEVPALKNTKQALEYFTRHGVHRENVRLVLNRFPSVKGVTLHDIQQHLRHPVQANLPSDGQAVTYAANKGVPVVQSHPQSWVAQSFLRLAAWLAGDKVDTISTEPIKKQAHIGDAKPQSAWWKLGLLKSGT